MSASGVGVGSRFAGSSSLCSEPLALPRRLHDRSRVRRCACPRRAARRPPQPSPPTEPAPLSCPTCAELREGLEGQHDLFDEVSDERDDAEAQVRRLQREVADLRGDLDSAVYRAETVERERDNARRALVDGEERFSEQDDIVSGLKRENRRLRGLVAEADEATAILNALIGE